MAALCKLARMDEQQDAARRFVGEIIRVTGWTPTELAKAAHVAHTTISRFLNNQEITHTLSARTIAKVREAAAQKIPEEQVDQMWLIAQRRPPPREDRKASRR